MTPPRRALAVILLLLTAAACGDDSLLDDKAVPFSRDSLDGRRYALPQDSDGAVVMLHFWTGALPGHDGQLAALDELWRARRSRGLLLLAVNVGQPREAVVAAIAGRTISYPVVLDPAAALARAYGVTTTPVTVLIDREGRVRMRVPGTIPFGALRSALETLL
ncbi:MAG: TlpA disulfide reductase family protein [Rhodospirillaceae bacterium]